MKPTAHTGHDILIPSRKAHHFPVLVGRSGQVRSESGSGQGTELQNRDRDKRSGEQENRIRDRVKGTEEPGTQRYRGYRANGDQEYHGDHWGIPKEKPANHQEEYTKGRTEVTRE